MYLSSLIVFEHTNAPTNEPALLPVIILGNRFSSKSYLTTPKWKSPKLPPPLNSNALLPRLYKLFCMNSIF